MDDEYLEEEEEEVDEEEDTEGEGEYDFISGGGCEICDALEATYTSAPSRPHLNCECQIIKLGARVKPEGGSCTDTWDIEHEGNEFEEFPDGTTNVISTFTITIFCWDGSEYETEWVYESTGDWDPFPDGEAEAQEMADAHCPDADRYCHGVS